MRAARHETKEVTAGQQALLGTRGRELERRHTRQGTSLVGRQQRAGSDCENWSSESSTKQVDAAGHTGADGRAVNAVGRARTAATTRARAGVELG
ncbi:hypothetical protein NL676_023432 [Syzygium grande]|nr:hypothetical protein NL676_023432 [Syzygium grande]